MKHFPQWFFSLSAIILLQLSVPNLAAEKIKLQFNADSTFKIAQFTDTHYYKGAERSPEVLENIKVVMNTEHPDLIILTGDIVTGKGDHDSTLASWEEITNLLIKYKTPYIVAFGNHDDEAEVSRKELLKYLSRLPYCILTDEGGDDVFGTGNCVFPVYNHDNNVEKLIYCMDSGSYSLAKDKGVGGYGWFDQSQIRWFTKTNQSWLSKNQNIQSLLFFHIPLPEYRQAFYDGEYRNGVRMEDECSPIINTGMFSEMVLQGNVMGTFVGHDHNNNYVAQLFNIALCYGYFSGGNSYGDLPLNGARIILLKGGKRSFTTWLKRSDDKVLYKVELPYTDKK